MRHYVVKAQQNLVLGQGLAVPVLRSILLAWLPSERSEARLGSLSGGEGRREGASRKLIELRFYTFDLYRKGHRS